ncbi:unnamed protein product, partial [Ectocarpus fasciculatus]
FTALPTVVDYILCSHRKKEICLVVFTQLLGLPIWPILSIPLSESTCYCCAVLLLHACPAGLLLAHDELSEKVTTPTYSFLNLIPRNTGTKTPLANSTVSVNSSLASPKLLFVFWPHRRV